MADTKKQLVYSIIDFIRTSAKDGSVKEDDRESLEVAVQCLAEAFNVDPDAPESAQAYSIAPASLQSIFNVFLKTKSKSAAAAAAGSSGAGVASSGSTPAPPAAAAAAATTSSSEDKAQAEALKVQGNALMGKKDLDGAIEKYTQAIALDGTNPVYFSNRAAAHGAKGDHTAAARDANDALSIDSSFSKAWSRLGHALYSTGEYGEAAHAYARGLENDPGNKNMAEGLKQARARAKETGQPIKGEEGEDEADEDVGAPAAGSSRSAGGAGAGGMPDLSALAGLMGGMGGGGGRGGGMPDLASLLNNPAMMQMAQQMMANGGLEKLMENPMLKGMADRMQNGGGMPDLSALAQDPAMRDLAQQYMGGAGRGAGSS